MDPPELPCGIPSLPVQNYPFGHVFELAPAAAVCIHEKRSSPACTPLRLKVADSTPHTWRPVGGRWKCAYAASEFVVGILRWFCTCLKRSNNGLARSSNTSLQCCSISGLERLLPRPEKFIKCSRTPQMAKLQIGHSNIGTYLSDITFTV